MGSLCPRRQPGTPRPGRSSVSVSRGAHLGAPEPLPIAGGGRPPFSTAGQHLVPPPAGAPGKPPSRPRPPSSRRCPPSPASPRCGPRARTQGLPSRAAEAAEVAAGTAVTAGEDVPAAAYGDGGGKAGSQSRR